MTRRVSTRALVAHHVRSHAGGGAIVALLVFVLAVLATATPAALGTLAEATLRDRLDAVAPTVRDVVSENAGSAAFPQPSADTSPGPPTTDEVWGSFSAAVEAIRHDADEPLPDVLGPAHSITRSRDNELFEGGGTRFATLAFDPAYEEQIRIVDGRMPEPAASVVGAFGPNSAGDPPSLIRIEVVLSADTSAGMGWPLGEARTIRGLYGTNLELLLVGVFEADDPRADYWQHVTSVLTPTVLDDGNSPQTVTGTAYAHPASLFAGLGAENTTLVWFPLDSGRIDGDNAERVVAALNRLGSVTHPIGDTAGGPGLSGLKFDVDVTGAIDAALARQRSTAGVIAMFASGPLGVAAAVLVLGCRLILEGRRSSLRLLSARGASMGQLRGILGVEGIVVGVLPAIVGCLAALATGAALSAAPPDAVGIAAAAVAGLAPGAILLALAPSVAERQRRTDLGRRASRLRAIAEGVVAGLAVVALVLLFVRGYSDGVDLLLAATPLLLALVACLVTIRLYPLPLGIVHARARAGSGLDVFLGSARALREPALGLTPVLALLVGVSVAMSSGVLLSTLQAGVAQASRAQVGADVRVAGALFTRDLVDEARALDGVAAATGISGADPATLEIDGGGRGTTVFVVDAAALRDVQGDGPGMLPPGVSLEPVADGPMPLIASGAAAELIGDAERLSIGDVDAELVGVTTGPVPIGGRENWVAIDSSYAEEVLGNTPTDRTVLVRLADGASADAVEAALRDVLGATVRIDTPAAVADEIQSGPAAQGVRWALLLATAVAALLSALAIVMTLGLAAAPRARVLALLRTLGAPRRSATSLAAWEIGPPAVAAVVAGTVFGALVPLVVTAAVDLRPFTGSSVAPAYAVDPVVLALTLGGFVVLAVLLTAFGLVAARRVRAAVALRTAEGG
ncbi:MAG: FtsX-like permease family protein [Microbacteriaceae bacterium]